jgi:NADH:ubiquinone oxidoreductase subunit E
MATRRIDLMVCTGTGCVAGGSFRIKEVLVEEIKNRTFRMRCLSS